MAYKENSFTIIIQFSSFFKLTTYSPHLNMQYISFDQLSLMFKSYFWMDRTPTERESEQCDQKKIATCP